MVYYPVADAEASAILTFVVGVLIGGVFTTVGAAGAASTGFYQALIGVSVGIRPTNVMMTSIAPLTGIYVYWKERRIASPLVGFINGNIFWGYRRFLVDSQALRSHGFKNLYRRSRRDRRAHRHLLGILKSAEY